MRIPRVARPGRQAFSLIELLCAILILSVGLVGLTEGVTAALRSNKESEWQTTASLLAVERLEVIRLTGLLEDGEDEGDFTAPMEGWSWRESLSEQDLQGLFAVEVQVLRAGAEQPIFTLNTMLFDAPYLSPTNETAGGRAGRGSSPGGGRR